MTQDDLEYLVLEAADAWELQRTCEAMDEPARAKLSTAAQKLYSQLDKSKTAVGASPRLVKFMQTNRSGERYAYWNDFTTRRARLALFALGPLSAVKKTDFYLTWEDAPVFERILLDRRPPWLDDWIAFDVEREWGMVDFPTLRHWIRAGVCAKPEVDGYYAKFASHLMRAREIKPGLPAPPLLSRQLLEDPDLLEDIPGLFRVETIAFNTNSWLKPEKGRAYESWTDTLVKLSLEGRIERDRLFEWVLEGLTRDFKQNQLSGFHGLYRRLNPTPEELQRHQPRLIDLLCHPVGHVAKFAIDMLADLEKRGAADVRAILNELPAAFSSGAKGNAASGLKLIARILARDSGTAAEAMRAASEALRHANADVQGQALSLLEANTARLDSDQRAMIADMARFVAATHRQRVLTLGTGGGDNAAPALEVPSPAAESAYRPIDADINRQTVLTDDDLIQPIASTDELLAAIRHAVEVVDGPDEIERIIDGISRLADDWPLSDQSEPVLHRLRNPSGATKGLVASYGSAVGQALLDLVHTWLSGQLHRTPSQNYAYYVNEDAFAPMTACLRATTEQVARKFSRAPLMTPTHKGGWIDPLVWVERLRDRENEPEIAASMDLRLSLMRLAPDNRAAALAKAANLAGSLGRIANFALGGDARLERSDRANYAAWITAARCRGPQEDWSEAFAPLRLEDVWPDSLRPARYDWRAFHDLHQYEKLRWKHSKFEISVSSAGAESAKAEGGLLSQIGGVFMGLNAVKTDWAALPTAAMNRQPKAEHYWSGDLRTVWLLQWLVQLWPQNPAPAYVKAVKQLTDRVDQAGSTWTPNYGAFHGLFQKGRPWREEGHLLLCLGLLGKDADSKGLAVDALIEGIDSRLFDPATFAAVMTRIAEGEWIKFNRLGDGLALAVAASPTHAVVVADALQRWLLSLDLQQNGAFRMLEVLAEAQAITGAPLSEAARATLGAVKGGGKAAKLARTLAAA